jgi:charged multivesicular body protein 5
VISELEQLAIEEEEEGPSYLADLNKAPDFVDEAPVELEEVCQLKVILKKC